MVAALHSACLFTVPILGTLGTSAPINNAEWGLGHFMQYKRFTAIIVALEYQKVGKGTQSKCYSAFYVS